MYSFMLPVFALFDVYVATTGIQLFVERLMAHSV
jgi:hypothetical protein